MRLSVRVKNTFIDIDCPEDAGGDLVCSMLQRCRSSPCGRDSIVSTRTSSSGVDSFTSLSPSDEIRLQNDTVSYEEKFMIAAVSASMGSSCCSPLSFPATDGELALFQESLKTTCMLRNIPNKYDSESVLETVNSKGFHGAYDFFYLPTDFRNKCNVGYAFLNFREHTDALKFITVFKGFRFPAVNSLKVCDVCWANVQGLEENIEHYRNSPIIEKYRPILFNPRGNRERFPEPDSPVAATVAMREAELLSKQNHQTHTPNSSTGGGASGIGRSIGQDNHKVFVGGLCKMTTNYSLRQYFSKFGDVKDTSIVIDRTSGKSRGFGFCLFNRPVPDDLFDSRIEHIIDGSLVAIKAYKQPSQHME